MKSTEQILDILLALFAKTSWGEGLPFVLVVSCWIKLLVSTLSGISA